jgi:hypothetical protein
MNLRLSLTTITGRAFANILLQTEELLIFSFFCIRPSFI